MKNTILLLLFSVVFLTAGCRNQKKDEDHAGHDHELRLVSFNYDPEAYEEVQLDYQITGQGDTVLFFVHGWNIDQTYWSGQVANFSGRYRVVTIDLPGHGKSGKRRKNWTVESYAKDLRAVIEKENLQNVVLVGHSMSGDITLQTALLIPDRIIGLVGVDNYQNIDFKLDDQTRFQLSGFFNALEEDYASSVEGFVRQYLLDKTQNQEVAERVIADYRKADPGIAIPVFQFTFPSYARIAERLSQLHVPLQLISCAPGEVNETALRKACTKGVEIRYIEGSGHFPMLEKPHEFNRILAEFLQGGAGKSAM